MSIELSSIAVMAILLLVLTAIQGVLVPLNQGFKWGLGSRDEPQSLTKLQDRFARTVANHIEASLIFIPLMLVIVFRHAENEATAFAAWLTIGGRIAFVPLYLGGVFALRSAAYGVALIGSLILVAQLV